MNITIENVSFKGIIRYPDITLESGKVHVITGESGCGKSTLLRLINNTLSPDTGSITVGGKTVAQWEPLALRQQVSLVAQESFTFPGTIMENFETVHRLRGIPTPEETVMAEMASLCRVKFPLDHRVENLSGGERHRLFIAMFLMLKPQVLMLDEPTAALDEKNTVQVISNIVQFCRQERITLLIVSHDREIAEQFSENTLELRRGGR